jgi:glycosyltransferase involved in cell wall biosynthesis
VEGNVRILLLADGRSVHTVRYQEALRKAGEEVLLASLEPGDTIDIDLWDITGIKSIDYFLAARQIKKIFDRFVPDIVDLHFASGYGFSGAVAGLRKKTPVILHCLGSDILISPRRSFLHKMRVKYALARADKVLVDSSFLEEKVKELCRTAVTEIVPWGIEYDIIESFANRQFDLISTKRPLQILVPRPHNEIYNNRHILFELKELVLSKQIVLTFPDWGEEYGSFRSLAETECRGKINFYSLMPRALYIEFLNGFDLYLSAALSDSSPSSLLDAMGTGLLPIVSDIQGVRDWINNENAVLFDPRAKGSLKAALEKVLNKEINIEEILRRNHELVDKKGRFTANIEQTIEIMRRMIHDRG